MTLGEVDDLPVEELVYWSAYHEIREEERDRES